MQLLHGNYAIWEVSHFYAIWELCHLRRTRNDLSIYEEEEEEEEERTLELLYNKKPRHQCSKV